MRLHAKRGRATRTLMALAGGFVCVAGWAQTPAKPPPEFRFDARRFVALTQGAAGEALAAASKVAEQRRVAALAAQPGHPGVSLLRLNRFGLPKAVVHPDGVTTPSGQSDPVAAARHYLRSQSGLFPFSEDDLANLRVAATSRGGGLTFLTLNQTLDGIPVFGGQLRMVLNSRGAVVHAGADDVIPRLAVDTRPRLTPGDAARRALRMLKVDTSQGPLEELPSTPAGRVAFAHPNGAALDPIVTELSIFPMSATAGRLAYRVFATSDRGAYEILVDASDGEPLYAASLYSRAGQANVWRESPIRGSREIISLPDTWLAPGVTVTKGNNADAYLDWDGDDEPDAADSGDLSGGRAFSATGNFDFPAGEGSTGQDPTEFPASAVTNAFYYVNAAHDYFYDLGFTEEAGNFQVNNFGRGGTGNDAVRTQVQDGNAFATARFLRAPEGIAPILELGVSPLDTLFDFSDDRDFALDGEVVVHEYAHGVTGRIVGGPGNINCLSGMQSVAASEGWSDYFGITYFDDPLLGEYFSNNDEHGGRRYRYDENPLTYQDIGNEGFQQHNDGEIWAATLWEIRQALGADVTDRLVMHGLPLTACEPSMIDARDGILDADQASGGSNRETLWTIFARRGMGFSAGGFDAGFLESNVFNAGFDLPPGDNPRNGNPTILSRPSDLGEVGQPYLYTIRAADPDGDRLSFELLEGPPGMEVDQGGRVTFTPKSLSPPRAQVAVTDGKGGRIVHGFSVPVLSMLVAGRSIVIDGPAFQEGYAAFVVAPNTPLVQFTLRGGSGDADLTVFGPDLTLEESFRFGADETITLTDPVPGPWLVIVSSFEGFSGVRLTASYPRATELAINTPLHSLQGAESSETFYQFTVPEGADSFTISSGNGSGDVDLFVALGRYPICQFSFFVTMECDYDEWSILGGTFETITVDEPVEESLSTASKDGVAVQRLRLSGGGSVRVPAATPGQWFLNVTGFGAYEGVTLSLTVNTGGAVAPSVSAGGVVHAASYARLLAPGAIASLFGENLAAETAQAESLPLPRELGGVRVLVGGVAAPLFYVSAGQINFQTPFETAAGITGVVVERDGVPSAFIGTPVAENAPGIFTYPRTADIADPVVVHGDGSVVSPDNPAHPGETLVIYATGISALSNRPESGEAAPAGPLAETMGEVVVTVDNVLANVLFAGLTPNLVGLLQINVQLPEALPSGGLELVVRFGESSSQRVVLAVE